MSERLDYLKAIAEEHDGIEAIRLFTPEECEERSLELGAGRAAIVKATSDAEGLVALTILDEPGPQTYLVKLDDLLRQLDFRRLG